METLEDINRILHTPINNLSSEDYTIISRFLNNIANFIVRGEFNVLLYESLQDLYFDYLNHTEPIHRDDEPRPLKTLKSFRTDTCVICLTGPPNVLFCNCGHLCLCDECDKIKTLIVCPVCKTKNTIKRTV